MKTLRMAVVALAAVLMAGCAATTSDSVPAAEVSPSSADMAAPTTQAPATPTTEATTAPPTVAPAVPIVETSNVPEVVPTETAVPTFVPVCPYTDAGGVTVNLPCDAPEFTASPPPTPTPITCDTPCTTSGCEQFQRDVLHC